MDFKDQIKLLSERVIKLKENIQTEEATKTAFILPFLQTLGYDVFDPTEVVPEFTCDLGIKKPFFEFNMERYRESQVDKLREFHKSYFDLDTILNTASELKYTNEIRSAIIREVGDPSDEFVKYFARPIYPGRFNDVVMEQFRSIVRQAFAQYTNDYMNERLKSAISADTVVENRAEPKAGEEAAAESAPSKGDDNRIVTTEEELQGFYIVRSILYPEIDDIARVAYRDTISYFGILLDDNNRKPICRLHFNSSNKYLETFDSEKKGTKHLLESLDDIYKYRQELVATSQMY